MEGRTFMEIKYYFQSEGRERRANTVKCLSTATSVKQHVTTWKHRKTEMGQDQLHAGAPLRREQVAEGPLQTNFVYLQGWRPYIFPGPCVPVLHALPVTFLTLYWAGICLAAGCDLCSSGKSPAPSPQPPQLVAATRSPEFSVGWADQAPSSLCTLPLLAARRQRAFTQGVSHRDVPVLVPTSGAVALHGWHARLYFAFLN